MGRSIIIVLGALALAAALFLGSFVVSQRVCRVCVAEPPGGLSWLQKQYQLNDDEMARIQTLHKEYLAQCDVMCRMIADKKQAVQQALNNTTNINPAAEQKLDELAACRVHCQSQMLQYFVNVSRVMPAEQGRRYLAEMEKNTLGLNGN
jgi:hypothetical protein